MRSSLVPVLLGIVAGLIGGLAGPQPAHANCYELIGCSNQNFFKSSDLMQLGCQPLWEVRNWIYKENGYCFKTPKAIKAFGNAGCLYDDITQVPLNQFEKYNVKAIKKAEAKKGC
jgi:YARHG domain-containing protein